MPSFATPAWVNVLDYVPADQLGTVITITNADLQDALDALPEGKGTVYFPAGDYEVDKDHPLVVDRSEVTLEGDGIQATYLYLQDEESPTTGQKDQYTLTIGQELPIRKYVCVRGMTITGRPGTKTESTSNCLKIVNVANCTFEDLALALVSTADPTYENTTLLLAQEGTPSVDPVVPLYCQFNTFRNLRIDPGSKRGIHITAVDDANAYNTSSEWVNINVGRAGKSGEEWFALHIEGHQVGSPAQSNCAAHMFVNCYFEIAPFDHAGVKVEGASNYFSNVILDGTGGYETLELTSQANGTRFVGAVDGDIVDGSANSVVLSSFSTSPAMFVGSESFKLFKTGGGEWEGEVAYFGASSSTTHPPTDYKGISIKTNLAVPYVSTISSGGSTVGPSGNGDLALAAGDRPLVRLSKDYDHVGIGYGMTAPKATLHSNGDTIVGAATSAVVDASLGNSQVNIYVDESNDKLKFKVKYSTGTVKTFSLDL